MADRIKVHTDRLGTEAGRIQGYMQSMAKELADMEQSISALERMWEGPSKEAFHKAIWGDLRMVAAAVRGVEDICSYDRNAKEQYEQCDRKIGSLVADIEV